MKLEWYKKPCDEHKDEIQEDYIVCTNCGAKRIIIKNYIHYHNKGIQ